MSSTSSSGQSKKRIPTEDALRWRRERDLYEDALVDLTAEIRSLIDRGKLGSGWVAGHMPAYYRAREIIG